MSYDIDFWRYIDESKPHNHQEVYEALSNGEAVDFVETIPVEAIIEKLKEVFLLRGWVAVDEATWESEIGTFQIFTTPQFFRVDCYAMEPDEMNLFIDIASEFGLHLYDPQAGERYAG